MSVVGLIGRLSLALIVVGVVVLSGAARPAAASPSGCAAEGAGCLVSGVQPAPDQLPGANERWIEVDLGSHEVLLREGTEILERLPAATGRNDTDWTTTYPGTYRVYSKSSNFTYLPEWGVYIRNWVGFDPRWYNGFHSFPMDKQGKVLDSRLGEPVTNGCVRTARSEVIYDFARIGMRVVVRGPAEQETRRTPFLWLRSAI